MIYLISVTHAPNDMGDAIKTPGRRETFAEKKSVRQSEFYQAAATGLKPELTFVIWEKEYRGEPQLEHDGQMYTIIRTYTPNDSTIELTCSGMVVSKEGPSGG